MQPVEGVQQAPSQTAESVAFMRALAAEESRAEVRGPDTMARLFLEDRRKAVLGDEGKRRWVTERVAPGFYYFLLARTAFFDGVVAAALDEGMPQIVFLGAGYDSRPYRFASRIGASRLFEIDAAPTQTRKLEILRREGIAPPPSLSYAAADLGAERLVDVLARAGFAAGLRTLFVWEGVIYYLDEAAVDATLRAIHEVAAPGSVVAFDHVARSETGEPVLDELRASMRTNHPGEPVRFRMRAGEMEPFLGARGFTVTEEIDAAGMERHYLRLADGSTAGTVPRVFRLTTARSG